MRFKLNRIESNCDLSQALVCCATLLVLRDSGRVANIRIYLTADSFPRRKLYPRVKANI